MYRMTTVLMTACALGCALAWATPAQAEDDPRELRHELMEEVGEGAKVIGGMLKGELEFDSQLAAQSLEVWRKSATEFGHLFPAGSETGGGTEAKMTIWTDREGFDALLAEYGEKVDAAILAAPQSLDELKAAANPIFQNCKKCHEEYRVEDE